MDEYFKKEFLPYVISFYDVTVRADTGIEDVLQLMLQSIQMLEMDKSEVLQENRSGINSNHENRK